MTTPVSVDKHCQRGLPLAMLVASLARPLGRCVLAWAMWAIGNCAFAQALCDHPPGIEGPQRALSAALCDTINPLDRSETLLHGVVVAQQGQLLAERYFTGRDKVVGQLFGRETVFGPQTLHDMRSISKSVVSLLIGIAQQQGKIGSIDTPVVNYLPESDKPKPMAPGWDLITLRHLLTMSSGLEWEEDGVLGNQTRMEFSSDQARHVLARPLAEPPGKRFHYVSGNTVLLGRVLERVTGLDLESYARQVLFGPLGIDDLEWRKGRDGHAFAHAGLRLRPRDLIKIGGLVLNEGRHNGRQIVAQAWVQNSTASLLAANNNGVSYGFQWWSGAAVVDGKSWRWVSGFGNGGQRLYVVPELALAVVIVAGRYDAPGPANGRPSHELFQRILAQMVRSTGSASQLLNPGERSVPRN